MQTLVIAGVTSGVGKTSIASAIIYGLTKRGYKVQPFKVGPDFIDPSYHSVIAGRNSRNLDVWMMGEKGVIETFDRAMTEADVAVVEGVMGLYDGESGKSDYASTAHVAKILDSSVVLVVDASKSARSIAAIVMGFIEFDHSLLIEGVIINNVAGPRHAQFIKEAFDDKLKVPIIGTICRNKDIVMKERHLGLVPAAELGRDTNKKIKNISKVISDQINFDIIIGVLNKQGNKSLLKSKYERYKKNLSSNQRENSSKLKVAVALDESFNFYYAENLDALRSMNVELVFFSPVNDPHLPECQGVIIGGGFPEVLADKLEKNSDMKKSIARASKMDIPIYAECGGLMYLCDTIKYKGNSRFKMVGIFDADVVMNSSLVLSYTSATSIGSLFGKMADIKGHEFHYSRIENIPEDARFAYTIEKGNGIVRGKDGIYSYNTLASYMHVHFSDKRFPSRFVEAINSLK